MKRFVVYSSVQIFRLILTWLLEFLFRTLIQFCVTKNASTIRFLNRIEFFNCKKDFIHSSRARIKRKQIRPTTTCCSSREFFSQTLSVNETIKKRQKLGEERKNMQEKFFPLDEVWGRWERNKKRKSQKSYKAVLFRNAFLQFNRGFPSIESTKWKWKVNKNS